MVRSWWLPVLFLFYAPVASPGETDDLPELPALPTGSAFPYGVASGDPLPEALVLWSMLDSTAVRPDTMATWEISRTLTFAQKKTGKILPDSNRHYRLKVDVTGLEAGTTYYYRFAYQGEYSATGRGKTAPHPEASPDLDLAVVSCNAYEYGYFNAFEALGRRELDAIVHLGDYIYEYGRGEYGDTTIGRLHEPAHELVTESDYHRRYAQYRRDPQLQFVHARHAFICVWDDHEVANNSYLEGAENHSPATEGDYLTRRTAAREIYFDWMPVREKANGRLYRSFDFGRTASLHMLDERLAGRTAPPADFTPENLTDTCRRMLGDHQMDWLCGQLRRSEAHWQLLGNQVLFAGLNLADILPEYAVNVDAWDGYAYDQRRLTDSLDALKNTDVVFLTGDTHCSWYFDIENGNGDLLARELAAPSVSSANYDEFVAGWDTLAIARYRLYRDNDHLNYTNITDHGYLLLHLSPETIDAEFHFLRNIRNRDLRERQPKSFQLDHVRHHDRPSPAHRLSPQRQTQATAGLGFSTGSR